MADSKQQQQDQESPNNFSGVGNGDATAGDKSQSGQKKRTAEDEAADNAAYQEALSKLSNEQKEILKLFQQHWQGYDPNTPQSLIASEIIKNVEDLVQKKNTLKIELQDGTKLCWMQRQEGEFIGQTQGFTRFGKSPLTDSAAEAIILLAAARGWNSVAVHGSVDDKNKLWLAAMRAGMQVGNFVPTEEIQQQWKSESEDYPANGVTKDAAGNANQTATTSNDAAAPEDAAKPKAAAKGPAKGTQADSAKGPAGPAKGTAADGKNGPKVETRFAQKADELTAAKPEEDTAAKGPKAGRGGKGRQP